MAEKKKLELITNLTTAISNCSLYSHEHPIVRSLSEKATGIILELMGENESMEIMLIENDLIFDKSPFKEKSIHINNFIKRARRKGVDKIVFTGGLEPGEIVKLVWDIADPLGVVSRYPHISTGIVEIRFGDPSVGFTPDELEKFRSEQINNVKTVFGGISRFKKLDVAGLEDIVMNFVAAFQKEAHILNIMTPFKSYTEFTYTHAANVAILTLFQAESLGIKGDYLHDIGIAALLHDVGKMFVSNEILEKKGKLDDDEWEEMQKHTIYGARYIMSMENVPQLAVPAALQHHLRYDGKGYPQTTFLKRAQHICGQIISISDVFDAMRAKRPYKRDFEVVEILSMIREDIGTAFNPLLANNFIKNLGSTLNFQEQ